METLPRPGPRGSGCEALFLSRTSKLTDIAAIAALVEPEAKALGLEVVRVAMFGGRSDPTLQVMAERPDTRQLTLDDCGRLSRALSDALDAADPIEHAYRLEVSSPGIDRPLTRLADYRDWAGHQARIRVGAPIDGRKQFEGVLGGVEGDIVLVGEARLPFADIVQAKLILTDQLIQATAPLSPEGADRIVEED